MKIPGKGQREVILDSNLANALGCDVGDFIDLKVTRKTEAGQESAIVEDVKVVSVLDSGNKSSNVAYCHLDLIDGIELYVQGFESPILGLPSANDRFRPKFSGYLLFTREPLSTDDDIIPLTDFGLEVIPIVERGKELSPKEIDESLSVAIQNYLELVFEVSSDQQPLNCFLITAKGQKGQSLRFSAAQIANKTRNDDVVLPWVNPILVKQNNSEVVLLGADMPRSTWLRNYMSRKGLAFRSPQVINQMRLLDADEKNRLSGFSIELKDELTLPISIMPDDELSRFDAPPQPVEGESEDDTSAYSLVEDSSFDSLNSAIIGYVPSELLESIRLYTGGSLQFDRQHKIFVETKPQLTYGRARLYCKSIDEVPLVSNTMADRGFAVLSEMERISEIHATNDSLGLLVMIVGIGVIGFGVFTVVSVLSDSTDRKRGTIGVLRVMGVSRVGVFYIVSLRAAVIGVVSGLLAVAVGYGISFTMQSYVEIRFDLSQISIVLSGALLCSSIGAVVPAFKASQLDPFEAILEGQFS